MKRILIILCIILLFPVTASAAWYLACDIPTQAEATGSQVRIDNGSVVPGLFQVSDDGAALLLLDLTPYSDGIGHSFEARFTGTLPTSGWSAPFTPGVLNNPVLRLIQQ
jgi:hypothetical protein